MKETEIKEIRNCDGERKEENETRHDPLRTNAFIFSNKTQRSLKLIDAFSSNSLKQTSRESNHDEDDDNNSNNNNNNNNNRFQSFLSLEEIIFNSTKGATKTLLEKTTLLSIYISLECK